VKIYYENNSPNSNGNKIRITKKLKVKAVSSTYCDLYPGGSPSKYLMGY
jgi:hypothetical protein